MSKRIHTASLLFLDGRGGNTSIAEARVSSDDDARAVFSAAVSPSLKNGYMPADNGTALCVATSLNCPTHDKSSRTTSR